MTTREKTLTGGPPPILLLSTLHEGTSIFFEDAEGFMSFFFKVEAIDERRLPVVSIEVDGLSPERQRLARPLGRGVMLGTCSFEHLIRTVALSPQSTDVHIDAPLSRVVQPALGSGDTLLIEGVEDGQLVSATYPIPTNINEISISLDE